MVKAYIPNVVPAECIEYLIPDSLSKRWTEATSLLTEAVGVAMGTRQKSGQLPNISLVLPL